MNDMEAWGIAFVAVWASVLAGIWGITKYYEWQERKHK